VPLAVMDRRPGSSRVICSTRQPGIGQSLFILRSMGADASSSKPQPRPAQSTQTAGEPHQGGRPRPRLARQPLTNRSNSARLKIDPRPQRRAVIVAVLYESGFETLEHAIGCDPSLVDGELAAYII